jgi:hypothetical protein
LDARLIAMGAAGVAGLVLGGAAWALSGGHAQGEALDQLDTRLAAISTRSRPHLDRPSDALAQSKGRPLFNATSSAATGAESDVPVQLVGLARTPARTAALLVIAGAPAEWLAVGETRSGVTLRAATGSGATVATLFGDRELMLGVGAPAGMAQGRPSGPPSGFKSPPPPASAPGMTP